MITFMLIFALLLLVYLYFEFKNQFVIATTLKVIVSAFVAFVAWYYTLTLNNNIYALLISIGLTSAIPADYFLQYIKSDSKKYKAGIVFFALMHFFLLISYYTKYGFNILDIVFLIIILGCLLFLQTREKWDLGKEKVFLSIYTFFVALMSAKAISIAFSVSGIHALFIGLGGFLFIISDFILGIWDYYDNNEMLVIGNRLIYFIGQLLFALSLFFTI